MDMTIKEAKELFLKYDGSLFAMAREESLAYENYKLLNVSSETVQKWKQELFLDLWEQLKGNGSGDLFNRMYNLSEDKHDRNNLLILKEALYEVDYINLKVRASISETVLGRKVLSERSGMVFWAYDIGEEKIAKELLQFVLNLVTVTTADSKIKSRLEKIVKKCYLISSEVSNSTLLIK